MKKISEEFHLLFNTLNRAYRYSSAHCSNCLVNKYISHHVIEHFYDIFGEDLYADRREIALKIGKLTDKWESEARDYSRGNIAERN